MKHSGNKIETFNNTIKQSGNTVNNPIKHSGNKIETFNHTLKYLGNKIETYGKITL